MSWRHNRSLLAFAGGMLLLAGGGSLHFLGGRPTGSERLVVLTPHGDNIRQEVGAAFGAWHAARYGSAPEIEWVDQGGTSEGLRYIQARFAKNPRGDTAAGIGIDLFFGGGTPPYRTLARSGHLVPEAVALPPEVPLSLSGITLQSPEEGWYGTALSGFGILSNKTLLAEKGLPEPRSWADLARPEALGWVASVDPRGSGSAHVIYEIVLQKFGWEKGWSLLTRMAANSRTFTRGASGVLPLLSSGEAAYTVAIDQYAWSLIGTAGTDRIGFILPSGETVITPDPAAVLKGAPNPETARRFLDFLLSLEGQRLWVLNPGVPGGPARLTLSRLAVRPDAFSGLDSSRAAVGENPFAGDGAESNTGDTSAAGRGSDSSTGFGFAYSDSLTESRWAFISDALGLWMVDSHEAARAEWERLIRSQGSGAADWDKVAASSPYFRPPGPWAEMEILAARWKETDFRNAAMAKWARALSAGGKEGR
jgi:ABC-type Fe3+ transport system substrate-binding protein